jgi:hypothetical protein
MKKEALVFSHYFFLNYRCSLGACRQHRVTLHRNIKGDSKKEYSKLGGYFFPKDKINILEEYRSKIIVSEGPVPIDLS